MIDEKTIAEILRQYEKHGWNLRRVLLSARSQKILQSALVLGAAEIYSAETDAAWFSRAAGAGREAWELRSLSGAPFALVEVFDADDEEEVREEARREMETRLTERASKSAAEKASE